MAHQSTKAPTHLHKASVCEHGNSGALSKPWPWRWRLLQVNLDDARYIYGDSFIKQLFLIGEKQTSGGQERIHLAKRLICIHHTIGAIFFLGGGTPWPKREQNRLSANNEAGLEFGSSRQKPQRQNFEIFRDLVRDCTARHGSVVGS